MIDDRVVCRVSIIGTVGCELSDRTANLVEEWRNLRDIASILIRQGMGNDLAAIGIQCQMQLSPTSARSGAMLLVQPLARAVNLPAAAVHQSMQRSGRWNLISGPLPGRSPCARPTAQRGVLGTASAKPINRSTDSNKPSAWRSRKPNTMAQRQGGLDCQI